VRAVTGRPRDLLPTPEVLGDEAAGGPPMAAMTAWQAFADTTQVQPVLLGVTMAKV
jgi:NADPH:quinone reductase-like Zn-dependent oxidoreductase